MSFLAKMSINDEEFNVLHCNFKVKQKIDYSNRPCGTAVLGLVSVLIESSRKSDFYKWSISPDELRDGEITFFKRDLMSSYKTLKFEKAYCVEYEEDFNSDNDKPMVTRLVLACYSLNINGVEYVNAWELA